MDRDDIDAELVRRLVAEQFPQWADRPVRPVALAGWDNVTFRLGDDLSVRLPSAEGYASQVAKEQRWLPVLAPHLPVAIPQPVAAGRPGPTFPRPWSIYRWLPGEPAATEPVLDLDALAADVGGFLHALQRVDAADGPPAGAHSCFRGAPLAHYDAETRDALRALAGDVDDRRLLAAWESALATSWHRPAVWVHGDVAASNLLVVDGRLSAVIDFGCAAVGDPACDLVIAWTLFSGDSRHTFERVVDLDDETWARARAWALWKALLVRRRTVEAGPGGAEERRFGWRTDAATLLDELVAT